MHRSPTLFANANTLPPVAVCSPGQNGSYEVTVMIAGNIYYCIDFINLSPNKTYVLKLEGNIIFDSIELSSGATLAEEPLENRQGMTNTITLSVATRGITGCATAAVKFLVPPRDIESFAEVKYSCDKGKDLSPTAAISASSPALNYECQR